MIITRCSRSPWGATSARVLQPPAMTKLAPTGQPQPRCCSHAMEEEGGRAAPWSNVTSVSGTHLISLLLVPTALGRLQRRQRHLQLGGWPRLGRTAHEHQCVSRQHRLHNTVCKSTCSSPRRGQCRHRGTQRDFGTQRRTTLPPRSKKMEKGKREGPTPVSQRMTTQLVHVHQLSAAAAATHASHTKRCVHA